MTLTQLYQIADDNKIDVYHYPLTPILSISLPGVIGIDADRISSETEEKERLAHELGHCLLHAFYSINSMETKGRMEKRANRWAIKKLVPFDELKEAFSLGIHEPWELAEYFDVSEEQIENAIHYYTNTLGKTFHS